MAKSNRNSGKFQQDGILGGFSRECKQQLSGSSAVELCLKGGKEREAYIKKQLALNEKLPKMSPRFVATGK